MTTTQTTMRKWNVFAVLISTNKATHIGHVNAKTHDAALQAAVREFGCCLGFRLIVNYQS